MGATTTSEFRLLEADAALSRRFQTVYVSEPTAQETEEVLQRLLGRYSHYHRVYIDTHVAATAVRMAEAFIHGMRRFPDKALDLLDDAAARRRILAERSPVVSALPLSEHQWEGKEVSAVLRVTESDLALVVSEQTGIPVEVVLRGRDCSLKDLEGKLSTSVVGQKEAVSAVSRCLRRNSSGLGMHLGPGKRERQRPMGVFLMIGPTGSYSSYAGSICCYWLPLPRYRGRKDTAGPQFGRGGVQRRLHYLFSWTIQYTTYLHEQYNTLPL